MDTWTLSPCILVQTLICLVLCFDHCAVLWVESCAAFLSPSFKIISLSENTSLVKNICTFSSERRFFRRGAGQRGGEISKSSVKSRKAWRKSKQIMFLISLGFIFTCRETFGGHGSVLTEKRLWVHWILEELPLKFHLSQRTLRRTSIAPCKWSCTVTTTMSTLTASSAMAEMRLRKGF